MIKINRALSIRLTLIAGSLCAIWMVAWGTSLAQAAVPALPPRPTPVLPTSTPMVSGPSGWAVLELRARPAAAGLWTVVQWQDRLGGWHDVEGWRGTFDEINSGVGNKVWWVARANFDTGPFRWAIYRSPNGALLATSSTFRLPRYDGETVKVEVLLRP
jgi:hypothetical protein